MKRFFYAVAAAICMFFVSQSLSAQVSYSKGAFFDAGGQRLSDEQVLSTFGEEIFNETYVGAQKQYRSGTTLITCGIAGVVTGIALAVCAGTMVDDTSPKSISDAGVVTLAGAYVFGVAGGACLDAGIPLKIIGGKRMQWMADYYNSGRDVAVRPELRFGVCRHGIGLSLNF